MSLPTFAQAVIAAGFRGTLAAHLEPASQVPGVTGWTPVFHPWNPDGDTKEYRYGGIGADPLPNNKTGGHAIGPYAQANKYMHDVVEFSDSDPWAEFDINYVDGLSRWVWERALANNKVRDEDLPQSSTPPVSPQPPVTPPSPAPTTLPTPASSTPATPTPVAPVTAPSDGPALAALKLLASHLTEIEASSIQRHKKYDTLVRNIKEALKSAGIQPA